MIAKRLDILRFFGRAMDRELIRYGFVIARVAIVADRKAVNSTRRENFNHIGYMHKQIAIDLDGELTARQKNRPIHTVWKNRIDTTREDCDLFHCFLSFALY